MSPWLEGILATVVSAALIALVTGLWRGLRSLADNTRAIQALDRTLSEMKQENNRTQEQQNARILDLETWRTAVTASLFRIAGQVTHD